jgi:hypothetical protein
MINARDAIFWTVMLCYAAAMLACFGALIRGWRSGHPFTGPKSVAYLSPFANIFLGLGFVLSGISSNFHAWLRVLLVASGLFQFMPAWKIWKRRQVLNRTDSPSAT